MLAHPDAALEQAHLAESVSVIQREQGLQKDILQDERRKLEEALRYDPDHLELREMLYGYALTRSQNLEKAVKKPYFTRVDFAETGRQKATYYIGKYGITPSGAVEPMIVDWRAPLANLYYSGQIGPMHYTAPDGEVEGELTLKRQLGIEDGTLETIFDTDVVAQDAYLQSVLGAMTGDRLREIVTTIQAEQNYVIRYPLRENLAVQGVAGSGKTTIALHRIAYLLYAFSDALRPEQMVILAPNPLFLNFIAGVLPDLGVERVKQTTFSRFVSEIVGKALPKCVEKDDLDSILSMTEEQRNAIQRLCRNKGSMETAQKLQTWLDAFEEKFAEHEELRFGPIPVYTAEEIRQYFLEDEKPFPLRYRLKEFGRQLTGRVKSAARRLERYYSDAFAVQSDKLRAAGLPREEMNERLRKLQTSRDARIAQAKDEVAPFVKKALESFPSLDALSLYRAFWQETMGETLPEGKTVEAEDIAPIAMIALRVEEIKKPNVRHIVIDEAQDFSPMEFALLKLLAPYATFTVVGDLMQGVKSYRGLHSFEELTQGVFSGGMTTHYLVTSYRNTIEIMNSAIKVANSRPVPNQKVAKPVLRHGDDVEYIRFETDAEKLRHVVEKLDQYLAKGLTGIAIVTTSKEETAFFKKKLPQRFNAHVLDVTREEYDAGILIAPASSVKGLEFDGVIVADACEKCYPDDDLHERMLYVAMTRALHELCVLYKDAPTRLLGI